MWETVLRVPPTSLKSEQISRICFSAAITQFSLSSSLTKL